MTIQVIMISAVLHLIESVVKKQSECLGVYF